MRRSRLWLIGLLMAATVALSVTAALAQDAEEQAPATRNTSVLRNYFIDGGPVVWVIELPMSIAMMALSIMFIIEFRRSNLLPEVSLGQVRSLLESRQYREAIEYSANDPSMVAYVVHSGLAEAANGYPAMERSMEEAVDERTSKSLRKIEYLNIIGNIAPMVGLFGTVMGMIQTFNVIVGTGDNVPNAADLARGISVALVTTFWGLAIAIPALSVFAILRNRIESLAGETALRGQELLSMFKPGAQRAAPGAPAAGAAAAPPAAAVKV